MRSFQVRGRDGVSSVAKGLSSSIPLPAFWQGRSPAFCLLGTSPNTLLSSPRASPCAAFKVQAVGPGSGQRRSGLHVCPGRCSAHKAYRLAAPLAAAHLQGPSRDPKVPNALAPCLAAGTGLGHRPRCLGSRQYPGSASWTSRGTETRLWVRTDQSAR